VSIPAEHGVVSCACGGEQHDARRVAITGGPGAGKTAVLEVVRRHFCEHVIVLPEAATIVYGGGFPRHDTLPAKRHAQIAIVHVQDRMERIEVEEHRAAVVLCDRGIPDGLAYWPDDEAAYWTEIGASKADVLARYRAVIHMRTPRADQGFDHTNPLRIENAREAARIDAGIERAWDGHPDRHFVASTEQFVAKLQRTLELIARYVPECCRARASLSAE